MNWVGLCFAMFFSSVWMYLFIRKAVLSGKSTQFNFFSAISVTLVLVFLIGITGGEDFKITLDQSLWILIAALFSYFGNITSLKSIELAPNPGYSLIISKSYVVLTALASVFFFGNSLTWIKAGGILLILFFSYIILASGKELKKAGNNTWALLAFASFFCWAFLALISKYLFENNLSVSEFLSYLLLLVMFFLLLGKGKTTMVNEVKKSLWIFLSIGLGAAVFNFSLFKAYEIAPNLGYVDAINTASISALTIASVIFFKDELTVRKFIGILGISAGLAILVLS